jgi:glycosyltransferase involved in cell wall biosynthesis
MSSSAQPTKVAYLVNQYPKTSHAWMRREIEAMSAAGVEVERISVRRVNEPLVDPGDLAEAEKTRVLLDGGAAQAAPRLLFATLFTALTRPLRFLKACAFGTNSATVAMLAKELGGPGFSFTFHGPEIFEHLSHKGLREKLHRSEFAVAISHHGRSALKRWSDPDHWSKLHLIHCGVDERFLDEPFTAPPENSRLVCVARMSPVKGHVVLLEAVSRLVEEGLDPKLAFVGGGDFEERVRAEAQRFGVAERPPRRWSCRASTRACRWSSWSPWPWRAR